MPISIAGSGTITGISVGGIPDGVVDTDVLAANAVTTAKLGTAEVSGLCKAWVNFNGTSTVAIRASYNVSSITDTGVGRYEINLTTALADANYAVAGSAGKASNDDNFGVGSTNTSTSVAHVETWSTGNVVTDCDYVSVAIFR